MKVLLAILAASASLAVADTGGGIKWTPPAAWKSQGERPMRVATYTIPAAKGDTEAGELAVFYFGPGQGGGVDANIDRWIGQFQQPDGKPSADRAKRQKRTMNGLAVTTIDLPGTYMASAGPMSPTKTSKADFRLIGAIVEGPQGAVFFKLTGPAKTIAASEAAFEKMLASVSR